MSQQQQQQYVKRQRNKRPIMPAVKKSKRIEILRERKLSAGIQIKTTTKVTRTAVKFLPDNKTCRSVYGRPQQTPYEDLHFRKVVSSDKNRQWAWCLFCNRRLKNMAQKRLLTHRKTCQNNRPIINKRYLKNLKMLNQSQSKVNETGNSESEETDDADEKDENTENAKMAVEQEETTKDVNDEKSFCSTYNVSSVFFFVVTIVSWGNGKHS